MMSRSEQRQLEAAMAASVANEGGSAKKKGSTKEPAEAPAKKKAVAKVCTTKRMNTIEDCIS